MRRALIRGLSDGESFQAVPSRLELTREQVRNPFIRYRDVLAEQDFVGLVPVVTTASFTGPVTDTITFGESVTATLSLVRSCTDTATFSEAVARTSSRVRATTDTATFAESLGLVKGQSRPVTDSLGLTEAIIRTVGRARSATDGLALADSTTRGALSYLRGLADGLTLSELVVSSGGIPPGLIELTGAASVAEGAGAGSSVDQSGSVGVTEQSGGVALLIE